MYSEFYQDKTGQIILITQYIHDERDNLIKMYENFDMEKRCCGLPPIGRKAIEAWINDVSKRGYGFIAKIGENVVGTLLQFLREVKLNLQFSFTRITRIEE